MPGKEQAFSLSAVHLKGGCGKTTLLTDVGILLSQEGKQVLAVDADLQGSMYSTLTSKEPQRYLPNERGEYLADLQRGNSLQNAETPYQDVNKNLVICHYPVQMFAKDRLHRPEFTTGFIKAIKDLLIDTDVVLVDLPPSKLESGDALPFKCLDQYLGTYNFLVVTRPTSKELDDGLFCMQGMRHLMLAEGIGRERIRELLVMNFHQISVYNSTLFYDRKKVEERVEEVLVSSSFPSLKIGLPAVRVPTVPRSGQNMSHYSILLDKNFDWDMVKAMPSLSDLADMTTTDFVLAYSEEMFYEMEHADPAIEGQREYLRALRTIVNHLK